MRRLYVRCMDGHFFLVLGTTGGAAPCPVDGSSTDAADAVLSHRAAVTDGASLDDLSRAGVPDEVVDALLIVEFPDGTTKIPTSLHPWLEGERKPR